MLRTYYFLTEGSRASVLSDAEYESHAQVYIVEQLRAYRLVENIHIL